MCSLPSASGFGTFIILSNLPGLSRASSIISSLFVAPIISTLCSSSSPSISVRIWDTTFSVTCDPEPLLPLLGTSASISSKNMIHGAACLAFVNILRTPFSDSPTHFESSSGPLMLIKLDSVMLARAFAISVLPVPGGP